MALDQEVEKRIRRDSAIVKRELSEISQGRANCLVWNEDYVTPSVLFGTNVPKNDIGGEFHYFSRIKLVLDYVLENGMVSPEMASTLPSYVPDYLTNLMNTENSKGGN